MRFVKFGGILQEIMAGYPNIELRDFLAKKLQIPIDKAEVLAERIEKQYCVGDDAPAQTPKRTTLEKTISLKPAKASVYSVECLSQKEFEHFTKWLFKELGYEVNTEEFADSSVDFLVDKDDKKFAVLSSRNSKTDAVSNSVISLTQHAMLMYKCGGAIVLSTSYFTEQETVAAQRLGVELWDSDTLDRKIAEVRKNACQEEHYCLPPYQGSLLQSLLALGKAKDFIVEVRADGKYDLFLPGVKYPLLTFQADSSRVIGCILRIKYNEPVGEAEGTALISNDVSTSEVNPDDVSAYGLIIQYLEGFLE